MPAHMFVHVPSAAMWLQTTDFNSAENTHLLMIFIGILAVSVAIIALAVLIVAFVVAGVVKRLMQITEEVKGKSMPVIASAQGIITTVQGVVHDLQPKTKQVTDDLAPKIKTVTDDLQPKIRTITTHIADISGIVHKSAEKFDETLNAANDTVKDANTRVKAQVDRVDGMVASALSASSQVAQTIHHSIRMPVNQVAGVVSGFRAGLDSLLGGIGKTSKGSVGKETSLEAKREEEMDAIAKRFTGANRPTSTAVPMGVGDDILSGPTGSSDPESLGMAADVVAGQRRAAELRKAPDASDLADAKPRLPKRFQ